MLVCQLSSRNLFPFLALLLLLALNLSGPVRAGEWILVGRMGGLEVEVKGLDVTFRRPVTTASTQSVGHGINGIEGDKKTCAQGKKTAIERLYDAMAEINVTQLEIDHEGILMSWKDNTMIPVMVQEEQPLPASPATGIAAIDQTPGLLWINQATLDYIVQTLAQLSQQPDSRQLVLNPAGPGGSDTDPVITEYVMSARETWYDWSTMIPIPAPLIGPPEDKKNGQVITFDFAPGDPTHPDQLEIFIPTDIKEVANGGVTSKMAWMKLTPANTAQLEVCLPPTKRRKTESQQRRKTEPKESYEDWVRRKKTQWAEEEKQWLRRMYGSDDAVTRYLEEKKQLQREREEEEAKERAFKQKYPDKKSYEQELHRRLKYVEYEGRLRGFTRPGKHRFMDFRKGDTFKQVPDVGLVAPGEPFNAYSETDYPTQEAFEREAHYRKWYTEYGYFSYPSLIGGGERIVRGAYFGLMDIDVGPLRPKEQGEP